MVQVSLLFWRFLVGEEEPTSGEINKKKDISLSYLAQDSRFESENTIYDEMLHVFDDLRRTEKQLRQMELEMGEKSGEDLDKLMSDYDRLSENFRQAGGFTYEADIRAILNGFKFDESMWQMKIAELSGGQNTTFGSGQNCSLKSPISWSWTSQPTTWILKPLPG